MSKQTTKDMRKILTKHLRYDNGLGHMAIIKVDEDTDLIDKLKELYVQEYNDCHDNAKEEVKEMTVGEIEAKLGHRVKVVK